jgi:long-subunit acyl-CoA synthetase (AMP-forming)
VNLTLKPWERVKGLLLLLEPFSLSNQQLTQTLKVKRHQVLRDYSVILQPFLPLGNAGTRGRDGKRR